MARRVAKKISPALGGYWKMSQQPLQALMFLVPVMVIYEIALPVWGVDAMRRVQDVTARRMLHDFFGLFGVGGHHLPAMIVVTVLLAWHFTRRDPWKFEPRVYLGMLGESFVLALPLLVMLTVAARKLAPAAAVNLDDIPWQAKLVFSLGAGVYEELVFRLMAIALLHMVFVDLLALPERFGAGASIMLSSCAFALYHFSEVNPISLSMFCYYALAGMYFAGVYLIRGFGVAAGTHAMFDILVVTLRLLR